MKTVGRWLGATESVGPVMTFWILLISFIPIPRSTVIMIQPNEFNDGHVKYLLTCYNSTVRNKIENNSKFLISDNLLLQPSSLDTYVPTTDKWDEDESMIPYEPTSEEGTMEQLDEFIGAHIPL